MLDILAISIVWTAEALNTAFEFLADAASPEFHLWCATRRMWRRGLSWSRPSPRRLLVRLSSGRMWRISSRESKLALVNLRYLLGAVLAPALFFSAARGLAQGPELRYDGIYFCTGADAVTQHFRFYRDGWVISVATPAKKTPSQVAGWLDRGWPTAAEGRYSAKNGSIRVTLRTGLPQSLPDSVRRSFQRRLTILARLDQDTLRYAAGETGQRGNIASLKSRSQNDLWPAQTADFAISRT